MASISLLTETYKIRAYQVDTQKKMHLYALCGLFQEIAGIHATMRGWGYDQMFEKNRAWMLSRLGVEINRMPLWREEIQVHTWVRETDRLFSHRDFEVTNTNGETLVLGSTAWLMLDTQSRRLMRVDEVKDDFVHLVDKVALQADVPKIAAPKASKTSEPFRVAFSDLDMIGHANNIKYIQWIFDSYPKEYLERNELSKFSINYLSEALNLDELVVQTEKRKEKDLHQILRQSDEKALCRGEISWK